MLTRTLVLVIKIRAGHRQKFDIKIHCGDLDCETETWSGMLLL
jgi:hypothetical protein